MMSESKASMKLEAAKWKAALYQMQTALMDYAELPRDQRGTEAGIALGRIAKYAEENGASAGPYGKQFK
jgi:hypothetical protein